MLKDSYYKRKLMYISHIEIMKTVIRIDLGDLEFGEKRKII